MFDTWVCPNEECSHTKNVKKSETCPQCGTEAKPFGLRAMRALFKKKIEWAKGLTTEDIEVLLSDETTEEELEMKIKQLMESSKEYTKGEILNSITSIFMGSATDMAVIRTLRGVILQNKAIACQNELLLRKLRKIS